MWMGRLFGRGGSNGGSPADDEKQQPNYSDSDFQKQDLFNKGRNQMSNEKFLDAIRSFELAIRIDPRFVDAWVEKGYAHFHLGEYSVAISSYDRAIEIDVENAAAWNLKGLAYYKMKNYEKAMQCCEKAIDIDPNDGMSWYNLACYRTLSGRADE